MTTLFIVSTVLGTLSILSCQKPRQPESSAAGVPMKLNPGAQGFLESPASPQPRASPSNTVVETDLIHQLLKLAATKDVVWPEDYAAGPLLTPTPEPTPGGPASASMSAAITVVRTFFAAVQGGASGTDLVSTGQKSYIADIVSEQAKYLALITRVRFLASHAIDSNEAAFNISVSSEKTSIQAQIYLDWDEKSAVWRISDLQGDFSPLSESEKSDYTTYNPQDVERKLIGEGRIRSWP